MLLEEKIHAYWQDSALLSSAIPFDRFFTAPAMLPIIPCAVLVVEKIEVLLHTNMPETIKKSDLRFEIHYDSYEKGAAVARLVEEAFDRLYLHDQKSMKSFLFRLTRSENMASGENAWKFVRKFQVIG